MKLYEIMIPAKDNDGASYDKTRAEFEERVLELVGGFTRLELCNGVWRDPGSFCTYVEGMIPYQIACEPEQFASILSDAFDLFADQKAIFTAEIGSATIHSRPGA